MFFFNFFKFPFKGKFGDFQTAYQHIFPVLVLPHFLITLCFFYLLFQFGIVDGKIFRSDLVIFQLFIELRSSVFKKTWDSCPKIFRCCYNPMLSNQNITV